MGLPADLVLVRHLESEGNDAFRQSKRGDAGAYTAEFRERPSAYWRVTDHGRRQSRIAGTWIRRNISKRFDRYYTSDYLRAMESAGRLRLPDARWYPDFDLRERSRGILDVVSWEDLKNHEETIRQRKLDPFYWKPPGGESMADVCLRLRPLLASMCRDCDGRRVIVMSHGDTMWAFRILLERMSTARFRELYASTDPRDHIHNGQILWYTRRMLTSERPTTALSSSYLWMRSVCPTDLSRSYNDWQPIVRPSYTNEELIANAARSPRLIK